MRIIRRLCGGIADFKSSMDIRSPNDAAVLAQEAQDPLNNENIHPSPPDTLIKARRGFVVDVSVTFVMATVCAGGYLAGLLDYVGASQSLNGVIAAIPVMAAAFQVLGAVAIEGLARRKTAICIGLAIHRLAMAAMFLMPVLLGKSVISLIAVVGVFTLGNLASSFAGPAFSTWIIACTPGDIRGAYFSLRERYGLVCAALSSIVASFIFDKFASPEHQTIGFLIVGGVLLALAIMDIITIIRIYKPLELPPRKGFKLRSLAMPFKDKAFFKVIVLLTLWQVCTNLWVPFTGVYLVNEIKVNYGLLGVVGCIVTIEKALLVRRWGRSADKNTWGWVLCRAVGVIAVSTIFFAFITPQNVAFLYLAQQMLSNIAWSVMGMALFNVQFDYINNANQSLYVGVCGAVSGVSGFIAAMCGGAIYDAVNAMNLPINGMQTLILLGTLIAALLCIFIRVKFVKKKVH